MLDRLLLSLLLGVPLVFLSVKKRVLTLPAALLAGLLLVAITCGGGWRGAVYMIAIYAAVVAAHVVSKRKRNRHADGVRGWYQVLCNGAPGALCLLLALFFPARTGALLLAFYAAMAEFLADTLASDIGTLSKAEPIDLCRLRRIPRGRSGGVSLLGSGVALLGCLYAAALALLLGASLGDAALLAACAALGVLLDSVLGSLAQGKFRCAVCDAYTEKRTHCARPTLHQSGLRALDNSTVNLLSNIATALLAALTFLCA